MTLPIRDPFRRGMRWWSTLSPEEKRAEVRPLVEIHHLSNVGIQEYLGLDTPNMVASVRHKLNQLRAAGKLEPLQLAVHINPNPPARPEPHDLSDEEEFVSYIVGRWKPVGNERPFLRRSPAGQRRLERQVVEFLDWRRRYA